MADPSGARSLLDSPAVLLTKDFQLTGDDGAPLAQVTQVVGSPKRLRRARLLRLDDTSHVVFRVDGLDGTPLFFVDRPEFRISAIKPPCVIAAPDGRPIGRIEMDPKVFGQSQMARTGTVYAYRLLDASGRELGRATFDPIIWQSRGPEMYAEGGDRCMYTDANGTQIAVMDSGKQSLLRLRYVLPDPLRLLVVASPLALRLSAGK